MTDPVARDTEAGEPPRKPGPPTPGSWPERKTTHGAALDAVSEAPRGKASESPAAEGKLGGSLVQMYRAAKAFRRRSVYEELR
jgi:hypothetical protein